MSALWFKDLKIQKYVHVKAHFGPLINCFIVVIETFILMKADCSPDSKQPTGACLYAISLLDEGTPAKTNYMQYNSKIRRLKVGFILIIYLIAKK